MNEFQVKYANLHLHSTYSDAQLTPEQLVLIGKALGYRALALTDHETDGGVKEFMTYAQAEGIRCLVGAEFYGKEDGVNLHLTALGYDMENPGIRQLIRERCQLEMEYTRKCVERGIAIGAIRDLTWQDVLDMTPEGAWVCIDSVINTMKLKKLTDATYDWDQFRTRVFKAPETKAFKAPMPTAREVISLVRNTGGIVALAHPKNQTHLVGKLVDYGLNGIEICHPSLDGEQSRLAEEAAATYRLYRCGGTDHTGPMSGCGGKLAIPAFQGVDEEAFEAILNRKLG